ncbi:MAG: hypothetical protein CM15mP32_6070 [Flavobacteriaceae bacterium]|nr:MAG: hypothetical protein CM15mP32_6070 [Flavobacteriaceae bacterium]
MSTTPIVTDDFNIEINYNVSFNDNTITRLDNDQELEEFQVVLVILFKDTRRVKHLSPIMYTNKFIMQKENQLKVPLLI